MLGSVAAASSCSSATATAVAATVATSTGSVVLPMKPFVRLTGLAVGGSSALGSLLRLRSASNGVGPLNGEAAVREEDGSGDTDLEAIEPGRLPGVLGVPGDEPPRAMLGDGFPASPLSSCSNGSSRCACTSFSNP